MAVVTVLNQKGGVGKTSLCHHLAGALAERGEKVLLIDNDPQASLTAGFFGLSAKYEIDASRSLAAVYRADYPDASRVIWPTKVHPNIDLVPGSVHCGSYNLPDPQLRGREAQAVIRDFLDEVEGYSTVLIDCPPNLYTASWAALSASDRLVIPVQPEDYGIQGITDVQASFRGVKAWTNPDLEILGYVISIYNSRRSVHSGYRESLRDDFGDLLFDSVVPDLTDYADAITAKQPITMYKPKSKAAKVMRELAAEFQARCAAAPSQLGEVA